MELPPVASLLGDTSAGRAGLPHGMSAGAAAAAVSAVNPAVGAGTVVGDGTEEDIMFSKYPVPTEDEAEVKRQRRFALQKQKRLIRNRVSAQLSRLKKRARMDELERMAQTLHAQNADIQRKMQEVAQGNDLIQRSTAAILSENEALRQHIAMLKDALLLSTIRTNPGEGGNAGPLGAAAGAAGAAGATNTAVANTAGASPPLSLPGGAAAVPIASAAPPFAADVADTQPPMTMPVQPPSASM